MDRLRLSDAGGARAAQGVASKLPPPTHTLFSADAEVSSSHRRALACAHHPALLVGATLAALPGLLPACCGPTELPLN